MAPLDTPGTLEDGQEDLGPLTLGEIKAAWPELVNLQDLSELLNFDLGRE